MSTILPKDEKIRRAVQWISDHLENNPAEKLMGLLNQPHRDLICRRRNQIFY